MIFFKNIYILYYKYIHQRIKIIIFYYIILKEPSKINEILWNVFKSKKNQIYIKINCKFIFHTLRKKNLFVLIFYNDIVKFK